MSNQSTTIPCSKLAGPALVSRVASTMDTSGMAHPSYRAQAGRCRFCGHPLPFAFAAIAIVDGVVKRAEWNPGDNVGDKLTVQEGGAMELGAGVVLVHHRDAKPLKHVGLHRMGDNLPPVLLASQGACEALTEDVFRRASAVVRERVAKATRDAQVQGTAKEIAAKRAARAAAQALAGAQQVAVPAPTEPAELPAHGEEGDSGELF